MAKTLQSWLATDVSPVKDKGVRWLSEHWFFRDPIRPSYSNPTYFFSPADGVLLYQKTVDPDEPIVDIKGSPYSLRDAMRNPRYDKRSVVIGVFMTFFDVHVNRVPYSGRLSYRELDPLDTMNEPMLAVEQGILEDLHPPLAAATYLQRNQRVINRITAPQIGLDYFVLQIADYDVDKITPFCLRQGAGVCQGDRFSQIRYGSQVDLIVPVQHDLELVPVQSDGWHVEAGVDPLLEIRPRSRRFKRQKDACQ